LPGLGLGIGRYVKLQDLPTIFDPLGRDVIEDHMFILEEVVCHHIVLLKIHVVFIV